MPTHHDELFVATRWFDQRPERRDLAIRSQPARQPSDRAADSRRGDASASPGVDHDLRRRECARSERPTQEVEPLHGRQRPRHAVGRAGR